MANSRIMLVCKHCGESCCIGKGYFGSYSTINDELHKQLNIFYKEHEHGCCSDQADCSDNARNHFAILEEGEELDVLTADVVPKSEVENIFEEIEKLSRKYMNDQHYIFGDMLWDIAELKKKYIPDTTT